MSFASKSRTIFLTCRHLHLLKVMVEPRPLSTSSKILFHPNRFMVPEPEPEPQLEEDPNLITVPVGLRRRLEKKLEREGTKGFRRMQIIQKSRQGRKSEVIISCKRPNFNHHLGQSYPKGEDIPLASKSWHHRKAAGDWFIIRAVKKSSTFGFPEEENTTFEDLGVREELREILKANNAVKPTLIQHLAIPRVLEQSHNLITAETGCGKTLAYLVPLVQQIMDEKNRNLRRSERRGVNQPLALILVPSHELASQIYYVASKLTEGLDIDVNLLQPGNIGLKITRPSAKHMDLLISTINVFSKLRTFGIYSIQRVQHVVLDEADTLLDDSFSADVLDILHGFQFDPREPNQQQLTLVSATLPKSIETTLEEIVPVDALNRIQTPQLHYVMPHVPQYFLRVRKSEKPGKLLEIIRKDLEKKVPLMIFCNKTKTCDWMDMFLQENGISCVTVHGETPPSRRPGRLDKYQNGEVDIIVCTDLGSRGINTIRTQHVLNYEFPMFTADYIHRGGRTGRVGSKGQCKITSFVSRRFEFGVVQEIERSVRTEQSIGKVNANIKRLLHARYGMFQPIVGLDPEDLAKRERDDDTEEEEDESDVEQRDK